MTIYIDADGCPVVNITIRVAQKHAIPVIICTDAAHVIEREGAQTIYVAKGADSVDFALVNRIHAGDIVITQDYGLAAMCLARRALVLHQSGHIYTDENISSLLMSRHTSAKLRRCGVRTKGPAKRTPAEDSAFEELLERVVTEGTRFS